MNKKKANFDTTYCTSLTCKNKCWRHSSNFEFEENEYYCFQDKDNEFTEKGYANA